MARVEVDREDLFAEARVLVRRIELADDHGSLIVAGFREDGSLTIYHGPEVMDQFTATGLLRRAYRRGVIYRTQGTTLAAFRRERSDVATTLLRTDLTTDDLAAFRQELCERLQMFCQQAERSEWRITRIVPEHDARLLANMIAHVRMALAREPWLAPPLPGKRM